MKIRCAIIGAGRFGRHYVRILSNSKEASLSAVAVKSVASLEKIKTDLKFGVKITTDVASIFTDPLIDAVVIATPVGTHYNLIVEALKNKKHVFVEKPMCSSLSEALRLEKIVNKSGCIFMLGHQYIYNDYIKHIKNILNKGTLGKAQYVLAEQLYFTPIRHDIGCFWETATHELAIIDYLFDADKLIKVSGQAIDYSSAGRDDFACSTFKFKSGLTASITTSWFSPVRARKFIIGLEKGMIIFDDRATTDKLKIYSVSFPSKEKKNMSTSLTMSLDNYPCEMPKLDSHETLDTEMNAFFEAIRSDKQPLTDIKHGVRVTRLLNAVYRSFKLPNTKKSK